MTAPNSGIPPGGWLTQTHRCCLQRPAQDTPSLAVRDIEIIYQTGHDVAYPAPEIAETKTARTRYPALKHLAPQVLADGTLSVTVLDNDGNTVGTDLYANWYRVRTFSLVDPTAGMHTSTSAAYGDYDEWGDPDNPDTDEEDDPDTDKGDQ